MFEFDELLGQTILFVAQPKPNVISPFLAHVHEDSGNRTALHFAAFEGHVEILSRVQVQLIIY